MRSLRCFVLPRHAAGDTFGFVGNGSAVVSGEFGECRRERWNFGPRANAMKPGDSLLSM